MAFQLIANIMANLRQMRDREVWEMADPGAPTNGVTGAGFAGIGSTYTNTTNGTKYINSGTKASPTWTALTALLAASAGIGAVANAKTVYDFSVDGGTIGDIVPASSPTIPAGSIILAGIIDVITPPTSGGPATITIGTTTGPAGSIKSTLPIASYVGILGINAGVVKTTADGEVEIEVSGAQLTGGKFSINLAYFNGN